MRTDSEVLRGTAMSYGFFFWTGIGLCVASLLGYHVADDILYLLGRLADLMFH